RPAVGAEDDPGPFQLVRVRLSFRHVPELDKVAAICGGQSTAVWAEDHVMDALHMALECAGRLACDWAPQLDRLVKTCRGEQAAVGPPGQTGHPAFVPCQGVPQLARGAPESHRPVAAGRGEGLATGVEGDRVDIPAVVVQWRGASLAGGQVPLPQ